MVEIAYFKLFVLVLARFSGLMVSAPFLGSANIPVAAKAGLAGMAAVVVSPTLLPLADPLPDTALVFALYGAGEFIIGLMVGFTLTFIFSAIQLAGQVIDLQTGFGMMNVFNPALETQFPIFGFFLFILAVVYLLVLNGHHLMIVGLIATYDHAPIGGLSVRPELMFEFTRLGQLMFVDGMIIAAPLASAMLLAYMTMGLLGRVVPQIHLFVVGFPLTIGVSLLLMSLIIGVYTQTLERMFGRMFRNLDLFIRALG
ncbi:MAG: flagellar biosynthetic protein FliR [Candidatus Hydrogenedentota bacterium]